MKDRILNYFVRLTPGIPVTLITWFVLGKEPKTAAALGLIVTALCTAISSLLPNSLVAKVFWWLHTIATLAGAGYVLKGKVGLLVGFLGLLPVIIGWPKEKAGPTVQVASTPPAPGMGQQTISEQLRIALGLPSRPGGATNIDIGLALQQLGQMSAAKAIEAQAQLMTVRVKQIDAASQLVKQGILKPEDVEQLARQALSLPKTPETPAKPQPIEEPRIPSAFREVG